MSTALELQIAKTLKKLADLDTKTRRSTLKKAMDAGSKIILKAMKTQVKRVAGRFSTGLTYKSLGRKVKVKAGKGTAYFLVGPRRGFKVPRLKKSRGAKVDLKTIAGKRVKLRGVKTGAKGFQNPTRYAHLFDKKRKWRKPVMDGSRQDVSKVIAEVLAKELRP